MPQRVLVPAIATKQARMRRCWARPDIKNAVTRAIFTLFAVRRLSRSWGPHEQVGIQIGPKGTVEIDMAVALLWAIPDAVMATDAVAQGVCTYRFGPSIAFTVT